MSYMNLRDIETKPIDTLTNEQLESLLDKKIGEREKAKYLSEVADNERRHAQNIISIINIEIDRRNGENYNGY